MELKEFFYVDVDRVRSLLAQLQGGLIESLKSESGKVFEAPPGSGLGPRSRSERAEEARSFQEILFVAFEQIATDEGWITDLNENVQIPERWTEGVVHRSLRAGQLLRLQCDVQVLDGKLFGERLQRFEKMTDAVVKLSDDSIPTNASTKQRAHALEAAKQAVRGGITTTQLEAIAGFVGDFVGDAVAVRFMPCGTNQADLGSAAHY